MGLTTEPWRFPVKVSQAVETVVDGLFLPPYPHR